MDTHWICEQPKGVGILRIPLPAACSVGTNTTIRDRQNLACERNFVGKCADAPCQPGGWQCGCARVPLAFRKSVTVFNVFHDGDARERVGFKDVAGLVDLELLLRLSSYFTCIRSPVVHPPIFLPQFFHHFFFYSLAFIIIFIFKGKRERKVI